MPWPSPSFDLHLSDSILSPAPSSITMEQAMAAAFAANHSMIQNPADLLKVNVILTF